jgi:hypothetical protein
LTKGKEEFVTFGIRVTTMVTEADRGRVKLQFELEQKDLDSVTDRGIRFQARSAETTELIGLGKPVMLTINDMKKQSTRVEAEVKVVLP